MTSNAFVADLLLQRFDDAQVEPTHLDIQVGTPLTHTSGAAESHPAIAPTLALRQRDYAVEAGAAALSMLTPAGIIALVS
jgi:hypothetical protein